MPISGSPKKLAQDIADGYLMLSAPMLKQYNATDLKSMLSYLAMVSRELRGEQIPLEDIMALKARNMKLSRLNQAEMVIRAHGKKHRMPL